jgi:diadenosine tetraphosphate (Ap4A) HIT family hydrolase
VRLQADARFAWIVLIPERPRLRELDDLASEDVHVLTGEILQAGTAVRTVGEALGRPVQKLNIGALGNIVAQLHVHVVGRRADDPAWPGPVWGFGQAEPYGEAPIAAAVAAARAAFGPALRP